MAAEIQQRLRELQGIEQDISEDIRALERGEVSLEELPGQLRSVKELMEEGDRVLQTARNIIDELELVQSHKDLRERISQSKHELQTLLPAAVQTAKSKAAASDKQSLLFGAKDQHAKISDEQKRLQQSTQITESLQRTRAMMTREIHRGNEAYEMLTLQGVQLEGITDLHVDYGAQLSVGRRLVTLISRKEVLEKILVFLSFGWFIAVILYITYARLFGSLTSTASPTAIGLTAEHTHHTHHAPLPSHIDTESEL